MIRQASTYTQKIATEVNAIPSEFLPSLFEIIRLFRESVTLKSAEVSFQQGWKEAMRGETRPVSELWV